jgi:hypothetical protein
MNRANQIKRMSTDDTFAILRPAIFSKFEATLSMREIPEAVQPSCKFLQIST